MEASLETVLPSPQPNDSQEVSEALSSAASLWSSDPREALRALRRAAESASDAGDDARSLELAKAAAELRTLANLANSVAPGAPLLSPITQFQAGAAPVHPLAAQAATEGPSNGFSSQDPSSATQPGIGLPAAAEVVGESAVSATASAADADGTVSEDSVTPNAPPVSGAPQVSAAQEAPTAPLNLAATVDAITPPIFSSNLHDPGQTVPATPAASAAAALGGAYATVTATPASMSGGFTTGWASGAAAAAPATPTAANKPLNQAAIAASYPTPVEVPAMRRPVADPMRRPGVNSSLGFGGRTQDAGALIEHRALRVAVSQYSTADGRFELVVLREGAPLPNGWRECLLVALDSTHSLLPVV